MTNCALTWTDTDGTPRASAVAYDEPTAGNRSYAGSPPNSCNSRSRFTIRPVLISPRRIGGRFVRGFPAALEVFLTTLEVFATSRFPIWEPAMTTQIDDTV